MTWLITSIGREHHLQGTAQQFNQPSIEEIAHSLAQVNRFIGHCNRPYSVAEHSLLVADLARRADATPVVQLAALMHDAHEAFTGDAASPVKWAVGNSWRVFEHGQATAVHHAFGLQTVMQSQRANIRRWDLVALATERRDLTAYEPSAHQPWPVLDNPTQPVLPSTDHQLDTEECELMTWTDWRSEFLFMFRALWAQVHRQDETNGLPG
jgi:hypothetical protein